jgi:hypothetical protein
MIPPEYDSSTWPPALRAELAAKAERAGKPVPAPLIPGTSKFCGLVTLRWKRKGHGWVSQARLLAVVRRRIL